MSVKIIKYFGFLIGVLLVVSCNYCKVAEKRINEEVIGIVYSKNKLEWSRGEQIIKYRNLNDQIRYYEILGDNSGLWDFVQKGDSLYKPLNIKKMEVYRGGELVGKFFIDIGCSNNN